MMGFGMFGGMFVFWFFLIILAVLFVRGFFQSDRAEMGDKTNKTLTPRQILQSRYARGEINRDQYLMMLKDIQ